MGLVRVLAGLIFASFVTSSSTLMGFATRRAAEERMEDEVEEGAKATAADAEQRAVTTARGENCMVVAGDNPDGRWIFVGHKIFDVCGQLLWRGKIGVRGLAKKRILIPTPKSSCMKYQSVLKNLISYSCRYF